MAQMRLGVVSFLNSRPLIEGLSGRDDLEMAFDVPSALPAGLARGDFDAALIPVFDVLNSSGRFRVVSDVCIGCDGETMTVRVFSQAPPDRIAALHADVDSHTSVNLARVLWHQIYDRTLDIIPFDARREKADALEAVLLIGDKVVDCERAGFAYETDLGGAWRQHTGLPFVFAAWAVREDADEAMIQELATVLSDARDRGVARAGAIAVEQGPQLGWSEAHARRYLTRCLTYRMDHRYVEGVNLFARLCAEVGVLPGDVTFDYLGAIENERPIEL
jgi:chorismate dehydratase